MNNFMKLFILLTLTLLPLPALAQNIESYIQFSMGLAVLLAVVMFAIGGISYMMSDAFTQKEDSKDRMISAIIGLIIVLGAGLILNTINPQILNSTSFSNIFSELRGLSVPGAVERPAPGEETESAPVYCFRPIDEQGRGNYSIGCTTMGRKCYATSADCTLARDICLQTSRQGKRSECSTAICRGADPCLEVAGD